MDLARFKEVAAGRSAENKRFLQSVRKLDVRKVDEAFHHQHEEVFAETSCLDCANCCRTTSPIFYQNDIERLARFFRIRPGEFIKKYLQIDDDNDYILTSSPCPFLGIDNHCAVYDDRPKACREYPHTHRRKMVQVMDLTHRNTLVCPAVLEIVERLKKIL